MNRPVAPTGAATPAFRGQPAGRRGRGAVAAMGVLLVAGLVAGCSGGGDSSGAGTDGDSAAAAASSPAAESAGAASGGSDRPATESVVADGKQMQHVHNLGLSDGAVLLGTHQGLFRQPAGEEPRRDGEVFDVMGLTVAGDRWLASGHPGAGMSSPPNLGLLASDDQGESWDDVALSGQVDFHRLSASGDTVLGANSGDGELWRSDDGGKQWDTFGPAPFDMALDPDDPSRAVGTSQDGPVLSTDGGRTWKPVADAPLVALVAWTDAALFGVTPDGVVQTSDDGGKTWSKAGQLKGQPAALAASGEQLVVLVGDTVWESLDGGKSFAPRITGLPTG